MYEGQSNWLEHDQNIDIDYLSCEFEKEGIVQYVDNDEALYAAAPGETDVYIYGHYHDTDTSVACANVMHVTVLEAEPLDFTITNPRVVQVGAEQDVWVHCEHASTYCPMYICESSDEAILRVEDGYRMIGVAPGEVTLTVTLGYGDNATVREFTIYVIP